MLTSSISTYHEPDSDSTVNELYSLKVDLS